jgi:hypothetical protein
LAGYAAIAAFIGSENELPTIVASSKAAST